MQSNRHPFREGSCEAALRFAARKYSAPGGLIRNETDNYRTVTQSGFQTAMDISPRHEVSGPSRLGKRHRASGRHVAVVEVRYLTTPELWKPG